MDRDGVIGFEEFYLAMSSLAGAAAKPDRFCSAIGSSCAAAGTLRDRKRCRAPANREHAAGP